MYLEYLPRPPPTRRDASGEVRAVVQGGCTHRSDPLCQHSAEWQLMASRDPCRSGGSNPS